MFSPSALTPRRHQQQAHRSIKTEEFKRAGKFVRQARVRHCDHIVRLVHRAPPQLMAGRKDWRFFRASRSEEHEAGQREAEDRSQPGTRIMQHQFMKAVV